MGKGAFASEPSSFMACTEAIWDGEGKNYYTSCVFLPPKFKDYLGTSHTEVTGLKMYTLDMDDIDEEEEVMHWVERDLAE